MLCFTVTGSSIPGHRLVGMGGEGKYKHMHMQTHTGEIQHDCLNSIAQILPHTLVRISWKYSLQERVEMETGLLREAAWEDKSTKAIALKGILHKG